MSNTITNYKCPACTGPLQFEGVSQKLACEYCGEKYDIADFEAAPETIEQVSSEQSKEDLEFTAASHGWSAEEAASLRAYSCPSCGAELICDHTTAATACPYCNNPSIVPGQFDGGLKPDYVIPFKLDKQAAIDALKKHYKGKPFLPKEFSQANHVEEIKGVYVPFWLYSGSVDGEYDFEGTKIRKETRGDEEITTTEYYGVSRKGKVDFKQLPVDGSTKMPDTHMDAIEPFDYDDLKPFSSAYLPGYLADRYDMDSKACSDRAIERIKASAEGAARATAKGYSSLTLKDSNVSVMADTVEYALLPVWLLMTKWNQQEFLFAMNGQTGKLIGDLPISPQRKWGIFAAITLGLMVILGLLLFGRELW